MKNQAGALLRGGSEPVPSEVEGHPPRSSLFARSVRRPTAHRTAQPDASASAFWYSSQSSACDQPASTRDQGRTSSRPRVRWA